jgi:hypothetical protein
MELTVERDLVYPEPGVIYFTQPSDVKLHDSGHNPRVQTEAASE